MGTASYQYHLDYLQACIPDLETYLLSKTLFWPLGGTTSNYPRLTLGGVLLAWQQSQRSDIAPQQRTALHKCEIALDTARVRWQIAWRRKAQREFLSRLRQWQHFVTEVIHDPGEQAPYYPSEVRLRVLISLLQAEIEHPDRPQLELLEQLDSALKLVFVAGDFIWDEEVASVYPREAYWFLWGMPGKS